MKLTFLLSIFGGLLNIAQASKPLFSAEELKAVKELKSADPNINKEKRALKKLNDDSLIIFKYVIKNDQAFHRKAMKHKLSNFYEQLDETDLYKKMYEKFLKNTE